MKLLKRLKKIFAVTELEKYVSSSELQAAIVEELRKYKITPRTAWLMQLGATMVMVNRQVEMTIELKQLMTKLGKLRDDYMQKNDIPVALTEMYKTNRFKR